MSVYTVLRLVHSYWRWAVLVAALVVFARAVAGMVSSRAWTASDQRAARLFITTLDVQFVLGIVLYFGFSPFWMSTIQSFRETMQAPVARFFGRRARSRNGPGDGGRSRGLGACRAGG
jgi:hypothetical protein